MLHVFRESVGRYIAIAILALIAITFIFFGIDFSITQTSFAAKVNGESIPIREFDRELQLAQNQYQQLYRDELTDELQLEIRRQVLDSMVMRRLLIQRARESGLRFSDAQLAAAIRSDPAFQVGGRFSVDAYRSRLAVEGLTPAGYEVRQREQGALVELQRGIADSTFITPAEFRRNIELYYQQRQIAWALFAAGDFLGQVEVTEDEIAAFYAENPNRFETEESVDIEYIDLSLAGIAATVEISEDDIRQRYEEEIERYAVSEERRASHILIEVEDEDYMTAEARAAEVMDRLAAGEDFVALAREVSDDAGTRNLGGELGWITPGMLPGPFEDTLFAMEPGQIEGPVETEFGYHIIRLEEVRAGDPQPYEAVRDQLRDELAESEAYAEFYDLANDLANSAFEAVDNLAAVAADYGVELKRIDGLTRTGGADVFVNPAPVVAAAFDPDAIEAGENSDLIDITDDEIVILRVAAHHPPEPRALDEVRDDIRAVLELEKAQDLAGEAGRAFADEYDPAAFADGSLDMAALATSHGGIWNPPAWVERDSATVPTGILSLVFNQPKPRDAPAPLSTPVAGGDQAVVLLLAVRGGQPDDVPAAEREQGQIELANIQAEIETNAYAAQALAAARVRIPDEVLNPDL